MTQRRGSVLLLNMSEAAVEELSVLSAIYCREGEFQIVRQSAQDGMVVQLNCSGGAAGRLQVGVVFHLDPAYPSCPPHVSISSTGLSKAQCGSLRQKLVTRAAEPPPEPMLHQLVEYMQECVELAEENVGGEKEAGQGKEEPEEWTAVLMLDHIRSRSRYAGLLERWSQQLQLAASLLLGHNPLIVLQGERPDIKEFCRRLKTAKVDVDASGKKCKERMMKVVAESPSSPPRPPSLQAFVVEDCRSPSELAAVFERLNLAGVYQQILPSLSS